MISCINALDTEKVPISVMHNIVENALEQIRPVVAKSYRDYRNYKQDFVRMLDDVYKKSRPAGTGISISMICLPGGIP